MCTIHYIQWNLKKTLNLRKWKKLPTKPINLAANTENGYLTRIKKRDIDNFKASDFEPKIKKRLKTSNQNNSF